MTGHEDDRHVYRLYLYTQKYRSRTRAQLSCSIVAPSDNCLMQRNDNAMTARNIAIGVVHA
jgi:hypothetical protein